MISHEKKSSLKKCVTNGSRFVTKKIYPGWGNFNFLFKVASAKPCTIFQHYDGTKLFPFLRAHPEHLSRLLDANSRTTISQRTLCLTLPIFCSALEGKRQFRKYCSQYENLEKYLPAASIGRQVPIEPKWTKLEFW